MGPKSRKHNSTSDDSTMAKLMEILKGETSLNKSPMLLHINKKMRFENMERVTAALT